MAQTITELRAKGYISCAEMPEDYEILKYSMSQECWDDPDHDRESNTCTKICSYCDKCMVLLK